MSGQEQGYQFGQSGASGGEPIEAVEPVTAPGQAETISGVRAIMGSGPEVTPVMTTEVEAAP